MKAEEIKKLKIGDEIQHTYSLRRQTWIIIEIQSKGVIVEDINKFKQCITNERLKNYKKVVSR